MKKEKIVLMIFGPPGAGKGTQAELLAEKFNLFHIEPAKLGEEKIMNAKKGEYIEVEGKKYYFEKEKKLWKEGKLWDPPFITQLVLEKVEEEFNKGKNLIFTASPRTLYEAQKIIPFLIKLYGRENIKVIVLDVKPQTSIWRNSHRRICELMRHSILWSKETENLTHCPLDGSKLVRRKGLDDPETIKVRLQEYKKRTLPVIKYFQKAGIKVLRINGEGSVAKVFGDILKALK